jgi:uncharacterized membrane protein
MTPVPQRGQASAALDPARIVGIDVARFAALVGMVAVHVFPIVDGDGSPSLAWDLFAGRASALFVLLAGVGIALSTGGPQPPAPGRRAAAGVALAARAGLLLMIGLLLGQSVTGVYLILAYFGVLFLLALPLFTRPPRVLFAVGIGAAVTAPFVMQGLRDRLPPPTYTPGGDYVNPTLGSLADPGALLSELLLTGVYPALPLLAYLCVGLAVGRLVARHAGNRDASIRLATTLVAVGVIVAMAAWWGSSLLLDEGGGLEKIAEASVALDDEGVWDVLVWGPDPTLPTSTGWWLAIRAPHSSTPFDLLHTTGTSAAALGVALLIAASAAARRVLRPLVAAGGMTLTMYCLHALAVEAAWFADQPWLAFAVQVVAGVVGAVVWRRWFGKGPLERLVGSAARRAGAAVPSAAVAEQPPRQP